MDKEEVLKISKEQNIKFFRLQFTDIFGVNKNVEIPHSQLEKALNGEILFDGSSIEGFARIEESDMLLNPDPRTFRILPWAETKGKIGRMICDIHNPDGTPFEGCTRHNLKRIIAQAEEMGYDMMVGPEVEFFLFMRDENGGLTTKTHDSGGYFDLTPIDKAEECRRDIVLTLEKLGFEIEASHHEVAPAQHEIDFKYCDALKAADSIATFKFVVRRIAFDYGLHATFMPKPIFGISGSGMHTHQSLFKDDKNIFYDPDGPYQLSDICRYYIGGLLKHARGMCLITNPLINSYKRLVPGYEAPTHIAWSERNRSPLCRVPAKRGMSTRAEFRMPDPSCNPYLAISVMLAAGLDGIKNKIDPGPPINENIYEMSERKRRGYKIGSLPENLEQAIDAFERDEVIKKALTPHIAKHFVRAKREEWREYIAQVHKWEIDHYLAKY